MKLPQVCLLRLRLTRQVSLDLLNDVHFVLGGRDSFPSHGLKVARSADNDRLTTASFRTEWASSSGGWRRL